MAQAWDQAELSPCSSTQTSNFETFNVKIFTPLNDFSWQLGKYLRKSFSVYFFKDVLQVRNYFHFGSIHKLNKLFCSDIDIFETKLKISSEIKPYLSHLHTSVESQVFGTSYGLVWPPVFWHFFNVFRYNINGLKCTSALNNFTNFCIKKKICDPFLLLFITYIH